VGANNLDSGVLLLAYNKMPHLSDSLVPNRGAVDNNNNFLNNFCVPELPDGLFSNQKSKFG
jgi:hypothetical protein